MRIIMLILASTFLALVIHNATAEIYCDENENCIDVRPHERDAFIEGVERQLDLMGMFRQGTYVYDIYGNERYIEPNTYPRWGEE